MSQTALAKRRWSPRLQFSLRVLLLAVTAFAIGFPIWYCWPFKTTKVAKIPGSTFEHKMTTTWRRQFGADKTKDGPQTEFHRGGTSTTTYKGEQKHGPIHAEDREGNAYLTGQYVNGLKEGVWIDEVNEGKRTAHWHLGKLDGSYRIEGPPGPTTDWRFAASRLTHVDGAPIRCRILEKMNAGQIDRQIMEKLATVSMLKEFAKTPLRDAVQFLRDSSNIPIALDRFTIGDRNPPRTVSVEGADIYSCLLLLTKPYGMDCDYRYGSVWITTASNAIDWHDPTGVSGLAPPPDSALAEVWNKTTPFPAEFVETPLTDALTSLQDMLRVKFDTSRLTADPQRGKIPRTSFNGRDRALKNILGAILYETGCTCRLDGESIVILPPEAP